MFIARAKFCEDRGIKKTTLQGWINRHLTRGVHFVVHGRTTLVDPEAIEQWLLSTQPASGPTETGCRSESPTKERTINDKLHTLIEWLCQADNTFTGI